MIVRDTAIPLALYPYSSTSRVVHWLTRRHGKVATLLKGALRPRSPFLGEYELFGTSELLYYLKRSGTLHVGKECALLRPRNRFRTEWRATQAASYLAVLFNTSTPDEAFQPGLFELLEELLDRTEQFGGSLPFLLWAELRFCDYHGHRPHLQRCVLCSSENALRFGASAGGIVCTDCARAHSLPTLECPPDVLAILRSCQRSDHPRAVLKIRLTENQTARLNAIVGAFMNHQFTLPPEPRLAACRSVLP